MVETFVSILIVYLIYYFVSVNRFDKTGHVKKRNKNVDLQKDKKVVNTPDDYMALPSEVKYFIKKYHIDLEKVNLRGLLKVVGLILGVDITILSFLVLWLLKSLVLQLLVASILVIPTYLISLRFLGKYFEKRGLTKNENNENTKRNRK